MCKVWTHTYTSHSMQCLHTHTIAAARKNIDAAEQCITNLITKRCILGGWAQLWFLQLKHMKQHNTTHPLIWTQIFKLSRQDPHKPYARATTQRHHEEIHRHRQILLPLRIWILSCMPLVLISMLLNCADGVCSNKYIRIECHSNLASRKFWPPHRDCFVQSH